MVRKVVIATPCYTGKTSLFFTVSLVNTFKLAAENDVHLEFLNTRHDALVQKSRNYFVAWALQNDVDDLIMIDDDICWRPEWIFNLVNFPQDVVSGIYLKKMDTEEYPFIPLIRPNGEWYPPEIDTLTGLIRVAGVPTGFLKLSKRAMKVLWDSSPSYKNGHLPEERAIFDMAIINDIMFSEDYIMCQKLYSAGVPVWLDPRMTCNHEGLKQWAGRFDLWFTRKAKHENFLAYLWAELEETTLKNIVSYSTWKQWWMPQYIFLENSKRQGFEPKVIYDIGACWGEWAAIAKHFWPNARIFTFEALEDKAKFLVHRSEKYHIDVLGNKDGEKVKFYINKDLPGGNSYYIENTPIFSEDVYEEKTIRTLDSVVKERGLPPPDFMKIDVQGAELDVLEGAKETLKTVTHMIVELQHVEYNKGAKMVNESLPIIESMGFKCTAPRISNHASDDDYAFVRVH